MKRSHVIGSFVAVLAVAASVANVAQARDDVLKDAQDMMERSFRDKGQATKDRLKQDELQEACSGAEAQPLAKEKAAEIEKAQLAAVKYPADGKYLGDYTAGEKVAQTGVGLQWSDKAEAPAGGNCYACHQLTKKEVSFGNLGPSLYQYGKLRGNSDAIVKYTWAKLYNAKAYNACSNMPRFGHKNILTEAQLKDVMALLLDPKSPVNE